MEWISLINERARSTAEDNAVDTDKTRIYH